MTEVRLPPGREDITSTFNMMALPNYKAGLEGLLEYSGAKGYAIFAHQLLEKPLREMKWFGVVSGGNYDGRQFQLDTRLSERTVSEARSFGANGYIALYYQGYPSMDVAWDATTSMERCQVPGAEEAYREYSARINAENDDVYDDEEDSHEDCDDCGGCIDCGDCEC